MAICEYCGKEMLDNVGCSCEKIEYDLIMYNRIKAGDKNDWVRPGEVCHDCGAPYGTYHHPGCDMERCPRCGHQLISCDCEVPCRIIPSSKIK